MRTRDGSHVQVLTQDAVLQQLRTGQQLSISGTWQAAAAPAAASSGAKAVAATENTVFWATHIQASDPEPITPPTVTALGGAPGPTDEAGAGEGAAAAATTPRIALSSNRMGSPLRSITTLVIPSAA